MSDEYDVAEGESSAEMSENTAKKDDTIFYGKIMSVASFGAFMRLEDGSQGMVHISELSDEFIRDINEFVFKGQRLPVVVLGTEHDGRKRLSVKKAGALLVAEGNEPVKLGNPNYTPEEKNQTAKQGGKAGKEGSKENKAKDRAKREIGAPPPMYDELDKKESTKFEDKLAKYIKDSGERLTDIKKQTEGKRGGGYVRRG